MNQQCARFDKGEADHIRKTRSERGIQDHFQAAEVPQHGILEVKLLDQPNHAVPRPEVVRVHRQLDVLGGGVQDLAVPTAHHHLQRGGPVGGGMCDHAVQDGHHHLRQGVPVVGIQDPAVQDSPYHLQRNEGGRRGHADPATTTVAILC